MYKNVWSLWSAVLVCVGFAAHLQADEDAPKRIVVCSTTQIADFAKQVVGDRWEVRCVLLPGQDPHLYQTKPSDIDLIGSADLCLANGWHLEGGDWMQKLATTANKPLFTCCLLYTSPSPRDKRQSRMPSSA